MSHTINDPIQYLKGVGPARAADFARLGVQTVRDLLFTFPRDLSDRSGFRTIADAPIGEEVALLVRPIETREKRLRGNRRTLTLVRFADDTGEMEAIWFNSPWLLDKFEGGQVLLFGKAKSDFGILKMDHPQFELIGDGGLDTALSIGRIVPVYPCTGKLTQNIWRKVMNTAIVEHLEKINELQSPEFLREHSFPERRRAIHDMHFPESKDVRDKAHARLLYDECLLMQLAILQARRHYESDLPGRAFQISAQLDRRIRHLFPFRLTSAQDRVVTEMAHDMQSNMPMHRLLQGDVGCGKTVVALYGMLAAVANGAQVCIMAPTSLLAQQHFKTTRDFLSNSPHSRVKLSLLLGGTKPKEKEVILSQLASGAIDILVSTHAAIQNSVAFKDLGLVVIDEQHKFGVRQRAALVSKGHRPDMLVMTATPIPRSLALTVYGDLDVSVIDELPPGRKPVRTAVPDKSNESSVWSFVRRELTKGRQAFVVSPLVEESETLDIKSATEAFEELSADQLSGFRLALLHGRMNREEQDTVMDQFRAGTVDVLVSTVVIEVGVDIPNATIMIILHAERFGLAQLHQLRGRVGRGSEQGHFILLNDAKTDNAHHRLATLESTSDGFKIAEEDLKLRGPGEFLGTRQHGLPELKLVDIVRDLRIIRQARIHAEAILQTDPGLKEGLHRTLRAELTHLVGDRPAEAGIG